MAIVVEQLVIQILGDARKYEKAQEDIRRENKKTGDSAKAMNKVLKTSFLAMGSAVTAFGVVATKQFLKFETGVVSVAKTTNLAGKDLEEFKNEILDMSERIPVTTDRLLEIATAAGQLGIKGTQNLSKFTETIARLGASTNVAGEEAAISLARILNLTNENIDSAEAFGSALVALGNDLETSEAEILTMATELAKSTVQFGLSSQEVLGLAGAMTSLGIQAESGSTTVLKAFTGIETIIRSQAGPAFEKLSKLTGIAGENLMDAFGESSIDVFRKFIGGLQQAGKDGAFLKDELNALGLSGIRLEKNLPTLAENFDTLTDSLDLSSKSHAENTKLVEESTTAFDTNANKLIVAQNRLNRSAISFGESFAASTVPVLEFLAILLTVDDVAAKAFGGKGITAQNKLIEKLQETRKEALNYVDSWNKVNEVVGEGTKKAAAAEENTLSKQAATRKKIAEDLIAAEAVKQQKLIDQQLQADQEMFGQIDQQTDDIVWEYEERQAEILANEAEFRAKFFDLSKEEQDKILREEGATVKKTDALYVKHRGKRLADEGRFGDAMVMLKEKQGSAEYGAIKVAANQVAKLINSENKELKELGKAATIIQITMSTVESAMKAFNSLAWIPYVGWALGGIAAAGVSAYGLEQINQVRAMKTGGIFGTEKRTSIVPGVGTGDKVNAILEPGELVVPRGVTKEIMKEYGMRKFADGGVQGQDQATDLQKTFAQIFKVPQVFKALLAGDDVETNVDGFGSENFNGMVPAMMNALRESAYEMQEQLLSVFPYGNLLAKAQVLMNKPIDEIHDMLGDNAVTAWISENLGSDIGGVLSGGGPLTDAIDDALNALTDSINDHIRNIFGFQDGGIVGAVEPGEMRLGKKALSVIAGGMSQNVRPMPAGPTIRKTMPKPQSGAQRQTISVEITMNENAAEVINAQIREGDILGTINPA